MSKSDDVATREELERPQTFEVRLLATTAGNSLYRVYRDEKSLYFIRIGGNKDKAERMHGHDPLTFLFAIALMLLQFIYMRIIGARYQNKLEKTRKEYDSKTPAELMPLHRRNFSVELDQIERVKVYRHGGFILNRKNGKQREGDIETPDQLIAAMFVLNEALGPRAELDVHWDRQSKGLKSITTTPPNPASS